MKFVKNILFFFEKKKSPEPNLTKLDKDSIGIFEIFVKIKKKTQLYLALYVTRNLSRCSPADSYFI